LSGVMDYYIAFIFELLIIKMQIFII